MVRWREWKWRLDYQWYLVAFYNLTWSHLWALLHNCYICCVFVTFCSCRKMDWDIEKEKVIQCRIVGKEAFWEAVYQQETQGWKGKYWVWLSIEHTMYEILLDQLTLSCIRFYDILQFMACCTHDSNQIFILFISLYAYKYV